jgi:excisionase family DNA binding protein
MQLKNMEKTSITFNDLPAAVSYLVEKIDRLESLLEKQNQAPVPEPASKWMDVKELQAYLPDHPAAPTIYGWIRNGLIPYYKKGKKLSFKRSEIEEWMNSARQQTVAEMEAAAQDYVNRKRLGK